MTRSNLKWAADPEWWGLARSEHVIVDRYELIAFDLPADGTRPREIGWELMTGRTFEEPVAAGGADSFDEAKDAAEQAWRAAAGKPRRSRGDDPRTAQGRTSAVS